MIRRMYPKYVEYREKEIERILGYLNQELHIEKNQKLNWLAID